MVLLALGGACLAAGAPHLAVERYADAACLARTGGAGTLACQAWLGAGGAHLTRRDHVAAAATYRAAASLAKIAGANALHVEALRMAQATQDLARVSKTSQRFGQKGSRSVAP